MWTWERERRKAAREPEAQVGRVSIGAETAVELGCERRGLALCAPGGILWRPREGQQVLVLKGEDTWVLGCVEQGVDLLPGEVRLPGEVTVDGEPLTALIRRIAAETAAGG